MKPPATPRRSSIRVVSRALASLVVLAGCGGPPRPPHAVAIPAAPSAPSPAVPPSASATVAAAPETRAPEEDPATESDYPDEPGDDEGTVRTVAPAKLGGHPCTLRVATHDSTLHPVLRDWITTQEARAVRIANGICQNGASTGARPAASFACRALARREHATIVACYAFPNVMGNSNPTRTHAIFDTSGAVPKRLALADMFVSTGAVCGPIGVALAARSPQLHEHTAAEWSKLCRTSKASLVADDGVSIVGTTLTFDTPYEFLWWGNAPDPLAVRIEDLGKGLTPRFAALLDRARP